MKTNIDFSTFQILINDSFPIKETFQSIPNSLKYQDDFIYLGESILEEEYLWLDFQYGKAMPRPEEVFDEKTFKKEPNPRLVSQIEPDKQLFVCILFKTGTLFISDIRKRGFIEKFLETQLKKDISIKRIFSTLDDFYKKVKILSKISFTSSKRDLFSDTSNVRKVLSDNYGMEEPELFSVEAKFNVSIEQRIKNSINKLQQEKQNGFLSKVIIQGRDDQNFEYIYNEETFINKMVVIVEKNKEGLFNQTLVKTALLEKVL